MGCRQACSQAGSTSSCQSVQMPSSSFVVWVGTSSADKLKRGQKSWPAEKMRMTSTCSMRAEKRMKAPDRQGARAGCPAACMWRSALRGWAQWRCGRGTPAAYRRASSTAGRCRPHCAQGERAGQTTKGKTARRCACWRHGTTRENWRRSGGWAWRRQQQSWYSCRMSGSVQRGWQMLLWKIQNCCRAEEDSWLN